jgi:hypothetical protein
MFDNPNTRTSRPPTPEPANPPAVDQQLAEHMEALFHAHGMTLTDDDTATVYTVALEAVDLMLRGALAQGALDPAAHATLNGMIAGMRNAPQRL